MDLSEHTFPQLCHYCDKPAILTARGCMDEQPVHLCAAHYETTVQVVADAVAAEQQRTRQVVICANCYRPIFTLDTHITVKAIS